MNAEPQAFEMRLRVLSSVLFSCPLCHCPLNLRAVLDPAAPLTAAYVPPAKPLGPLNGLAERAERWCVEARIKPEDLRLKARYPELVLLRARFCRAMRDEHFSLPTIGRWLGIHHTSVMHLLRRGSAAAPNAKRNGSNPRSSAVRS